MNRRLQLALIATSWVALAAERPAIGVLTEFPAGATAAVQQEFRQETERAMRAAGMELIWRDLRDSRAEENFDRLVVIRFRGECAAPKSVSFGGKLPLGLTHVSNGQVLPFVEIDCQRILEAMYAGDGQAQFRQEGMIGRALGRVAAHEICHVLTASGTHDEEGLMRPSLDRRDLFAVELSFSAKSIRRLRMSLGPAGPQTLAQARTNSDD
ncbi:MAG TPA: hypothetical protein VGK29_04915 [Paludibaculum sp.]|jgi:hypothetical protein